MPRLARLNAPGVLRHIIIRGIERSKIFRDDKDRDDLIDRLSDLLPATQTACYAWAFMPNHAHFLLSFLCMRAGQCPLPHLPSIVSGQWLFLQHIAGDHSHPDP